MNQEKDSAAKAPESRVSGGAAGKKDLEMEARFAKGWGVLKKEKRVGRRGTNQRERGQLVPTESGGKGIH